MRKPRQLPPTSYLHECFEYDPETGLLTWKHRPLCHFNGSHGFHTFEANYAGKPAFTASCGRYKHGAIDGVLYRAHRVIWKMLHDEEPDMVDHINRDGSDNRAVNLRAANSAGNARNTGMRADNKSGLKGVCWNKQVNKWMAQIRVCGRTKFLGHYDNKHAAHAAYRRAAAELHGDFASFG